MSKIISVTPSIIGIKTMLLNHLVLVFHLFICLPCSGSVNDDDKNREKVSRAV